jgi:class 3 adenylate cyclase
LARQEGPSVRSNTLVTKILELAREDPRQLEQLEAFRRAVTVMFTDIKGSTEYFENFGDIAGLAMVHECNDTLRCEIETHGGRVIKTIGDAVMGAFEDNDQSVRAAIMMQRRLRERNATRKKSDHILVRIGIHHGTGIVKSDDVFGDVVNVASRVQSIAQPEQIVVSDALQKTISSRSEFDLEFIGRFRLKGKSEDRDLYQVRWSNTQNLPSIGAVHTTISRVYREGVTLQQLSPDGSIKCEYRVTANGITVGNAEPDPKSLGYSKLEVVRARFLLLDGQPTVQDVGKTGRVFIRLIATYTLENNEIVVMGKRMFKFLCDSDLLEAATTIGKTLSSVNELLREPAAEFVGVMPDGSEREERYPLWDEDITFGRVGATYSFNDDGLMSRSHSRVYHRGEDFFLEDLSSLNGTWVMVRDKAPVPIGASVLVGGQVYRIVQ